jgi:L-threonylcarbamoyladenylate synthase
MTARILSVDPEQPGSDSIAAAAAALRAGGVVAFPTETFYGLGAAMHCERALARVLAIKGRPEGKPLLVLVSSVAMAESVAEVAPAAHRLMERYWPGALTLVLPARPGVSSLITAGTGTVGVRHSAHRVPSALVERLGEPITAPSANPSGEPPPTTACEVVRAFAGGVDVVLDGGPTTGGLPSTVLDLTVSPPVVLRAGAVVL